MLLGGDSLMAATGPDAANVGARRLARVFSSCSPACEPVLYQVATLVPHCAVNRAATNSSQDPPVLGCCQQPTNSPASGASRRAGAKLAL